MRWNCPSKKEKGWMHILKTLGEMQAKDWLTLSVSVIALAVAIFSFKQKSTEYRLSIRKQVADLIAKLHDLNVEFAKSTSRSKKDDLPEAYEGHITDQRRFNVRQADYLCDKIPDLISPFEHIILAINFVDIGDGLQAEKHFRLGLQSKLFGIERSVAL
jgi:hypothetical protein